MERKRILVFAGTRPEVIKLFPVWKALNNNDSVDVKWISTGQHKEMLVGLFELFGFSPDYEIESLKGADLTTLCAHIMRESSKLIEGYTPDCIVVQGDTTSAMTAGLCAFYQKIKVAHIEAGLRSFDNYSPYPEEVNRKIISSFANYHYTPTELAEGYLQEEKAQGEIFTTGNTVIDSLHYASNALDQKSNQYTEIDDLLVRYRHLVLITGHRRENLGDGLKQICNAIKQLSKMHPQVAFVYPIHLNPQVFEPVKKMLAGLSNVLLWEPLSYDTLIYMFKRAYLVLTDSGGIQEEAPSFGLPVLVTRDTTERPEGIEAGCAKLVGTDSAIIVKEVDKVLQDTQYHNQFVVDTNPYGDGKSGERIAQHLVKALSD